MYLLNYMFNIHTAIPHIEPMLGFFFKYNYYVLAKIHLKYK